MSAADWNSRFCTVPSTDKIISRSWHNFYFGFTVTINMIVAGSEINKFNVFTNMQMIVACTCINSSCTKIKNRIVAVACDNYHAFTCIIFYGVIAVANIDCCICSPIINRIIATSCCNQYAIIWPGRITDTIWTFSCVDCNVRALIIVDAVVSIT